jgi:hypothetical protein
LIALAQTLAPALTLALARRLMPALMPSLASMLLLTAGLG